MKDIRYLGLDVDSEKIAVAVAEPGSEVRSLGANPHREDSVRRLVKKLGPASRLRVCYDAGPHGYSLYRFAAATDSDGGTCQACLYIVVPEARARSES